MVSAVGPSMENGNRSFSYSPIPKPVKSRAMNSIHGMESKGRISVGFG